MVTFFNLQVDGKLDEWDGVLTSVLGISVTTGFDKELSPARSIIAWPAMKIC